MPRSYSPRFRRRVLDLAAARKQIAELEAELAIHRRSAELLGAVASPTGGSKPSG